jgi:DNA modification methylase
LNWGLRTWDHWYFNDLDQRFGDNWPGQIPAQLVAHTLFYFTKQGDLVLDPMAGGGVVPDTCLAFNRKCRSFDLVDRPETRPEIEPHQWNPEGLLWPVKGKEKPDFLFFDPPYFNKLADQYTKDSISSLPRKEYLGFFREFFPLAKENSKAKARIGFLNADWRDFQGVSALNEDPGQSILLWDYMNILNRSGWEITHIIDCPMSTQRFQANIVAQMQKNRTLGIVRRSLIIGRKK